MDVGRDTILEIDTKTGKVVFHSLGAWGQRLSLSVDQSYQYEKTLIDFTHQFVDRDYKDAMLEGFSINDLMKLQDNGQKPVISRLVKIYNLDTQIYEWYRVSIVAPVGGICYGTIRNCHQETLREIKLHKSAETDALTGLMNRVAFEKAVNEHLQDSSESGALYIISIDSIKAINERFGRQYGDYAITAIAKKLRDVLPSDALTARFGGDEFLLYMPCADGKAKAQLYAEVICESMAAIDTKYPITVSVGIALYPKQGNSISTLLGFSDRALHHVKKTGKGAYAVYHDSMRNTAQAEQPMERVAIDQHQANSKGTGWAVITIGGLSLFIAEILLFTPSKGVNASMDWRTVLSILSVILILVLCAVIIIQQRKRKELEKSAPMSHAADEQNRVKLIADMRERLSRKDYDCSLICVSIEKFWLYRERKGQSAADQLLLRLDSVLRGKLLEDESAGRITDDCFAVLLHTQSVDAIRQRVLAWHEALRNGEDDQERYGSVRLRFGVCVVNDAVQNPEDIIEHARIAIHAHDNANDSAEPTLSYYDMTIQEAQEKERQIEESMQRAYQNDEFTPYLQPIVSSGTEPSFFELLARWHLPNGDVLMPDEFIPLFDKNGFIVKLDRFLLESVLSMMDALIRDGERPPRVSFNVSCTELMNGNLVRTYTEICGKYHVPPELLIFEFDESLMEEARPLLHDAIESLRAKGFLCAIDHFGRQSSSLSLLRDTPVDMLKLDPTLLGDECNPSDRGRVILQAIVGLAHSLGIQCAAQRIERREQAAYLKEFGFDWIQGFLYAKPMPAKEVLKRAEKPIPSPDDAQ